MFDSKNQVLQSYNPTCTMLQNVRGGVTELFVCLGGAITAGRDLSIEITRRLQRAWVCFQRYKMEIYDRPGVRLRLKVRLLKAEAVETLLYGCMTWSPKKPGYDGFTAPCSSDALDGGNGSATTTPYRTPMRLPRQLPRA